jgi:hypothetical protein
MLNYSNTHRKDPKTKSNAFWCAVTLASIFTVGFLLINYYEAIFSGIKYVFTGIWAGISIAFVSTANFSKPVLAVAGNYIVGILAFAWLWSLCVYSKTETTCFQSIIEWRNICIVINSILLLYLTVYFVYFGINFEKVPAYAHFYLVIYLFGIFSYIYLICRTSEIINENK